MVAKNIQDLDAFLATLSSPTTARRYQAQMERLRADLRTNVLRDSSLIAQEEVDGLLALYLEAGQGTGDRKRLARSLESLRQRFPESDELYAELHAALLGKESLLPEAVTLPEPVALPLPALRPAMASETTDDEPWSFRLRNRLFGSVPAIIVRLSDTLMDALTTPQLSLQGAVARGDGDDSWVDELFAPVLAQEVTLEGRNYFAELFARHTNVAMCFMAGLTSDEPLPSDSMVHMRIGRKSCSARFGRDGRADLGLLPLNLFGKDVRNSPVELVFEIPHSGARRPS